MLQPREIYWNLVWIQPFPKVRFFSLPIPLSCGSANALTHQGINLSTVWHPTFEIWIVLYIPDATSRLSSLLHKAAGLITCLGRLIQSDVLNCLKVLGVCCLHLFWCSRVSESWTWPFVKYFHCFIHPGFCSCLTLLCVPMSFLNK